MSFLFSTPSTPAVQQLPVAPASSADDSAAREAATREAVLRQRAAGRQSTMVGGMQLAADEQQSKGLMASSKRAAARELG